MRRAFLGIDDDEKEGMTKAEWVEKATERFRGDERLRGLLERTTDEHAGRIAGVHIS